MIEVRNLTKFYGRYQALDDVSFTVNQGEVVGLLGPNGAGKATTLNAVTGVIFPNQGEVYVNGLKMTENEQAIKQQIGYLAEDNPLYQNLLVIESLNLAASLKGMGKSEFQQGLEKVLRITNLNEVLSRPIESLSKGYRQRVGLAQALINNPPVLILDEPTEGLDPNQRQEIRHLIRELKREHTVLLSTHVMQEVEAICQKVIILNHGRVVAVGPLDQIKKKTQDLTDVELILRGPRATELIEILTERFALIINENLPEHGHITIQLQPAQEDEFYTFLGDKTSSEVYISHLVKKEFGLEEVFQKLTNDV